MLREQRVASRRAFGSVPQVLHFYECFSGSVAYVDTRRFIDEVTDKEVKYMSVKYDAVLFHYQVFRYHNKADPSVNMTKLDEYAEFYYS